MRVANTLNDSRSWMSGVYALLRSGNIRGTVTLVGRTVLRSRKPICIRIRSIPISVRPCTPDLAVARNCFAGEFDAAIAAAKPLKHNLIIDAGGYIGTAAIVLAEAFPDATVVSLEPSRENFRVLAMNVAAFPNIIPLNVALGSREGSVQLVDRATGEVGFSTVQAPADCASPSRLHDVAVITVTDLMKRFHASGIDFLKLDIEGAEHDLLKSSPSWIDATRIIFAELHDRIVPGCEAIFAEMTANRDNSICGSGEKILSVSRA
jgi:FkbM family methyltransferase